MSEFSERLLSVAVGGYPMSDVRDALIRGVREIERLQAIVDAQHDVIGCYEDETDRSQHADDELPDDLVEAEQALAKAKGEA